MPFSPEIALDADEFRKLCHDCAPNVQIGPGQNLCDLTLEERDGWIDDRIADGKLLIVVLDGD